MRAETKVQLALTIVGIPVIMLVVCTMWPSAPFNPIKKTPNLSMGNRL